MRKQAGLLFLIKLFKIPANLLLLSLTAKYFGVSIAKDVWLLAFATMTVLDSALWGPINETFRTKFVAIKEQKSARVAISHTQSLLTYFIFFSLILMGIVIAFPHFFSVVIAPKYSEQNRAILVDMLYIVAPVLIFNQLMQIGISILNAYEIFFVAEISAFASTILNILLLYFFVNSIGISALPTAYYISTGLLIISILFVMYRNKIPLFSGEWNFKFTGFKLFFIFSMPFYLPYFFAQINSLVEKILVGGLGYGFISVLDFSNRIPTMLYGVIINIITTILVPVLTKYYIRGEKENYNEEFRKIFQLGLLFIGIIAAFIAGCSIPLVHILYDKGAISQASLSLISDITILYGFALLGIFIYVIFGMSLLSSENQKYYAVMGMLTQILVVILNFILVKWSGIYIFPVSILIAHTVFGYIMAKKYPYRSGLRLHLKYFLFITVLAMIMYFGVRNVDMNNLYYTLIAQCILMGVLIVLLSFIFKLEENKLVMNLVKSKLNRGIDKL